MFVTYVNVMAKRRAISRARRHIQALNTTLTKALLRHFGGILGLIANKRPRRRHLRPRLRLRRHCGAGNRTSATKRRGYKRGLEQVRRRP